MTDVVMIDLGSADWDADGVGRRRWPRWWRRWTVAGVLLVMAVGLGGAAPTPSGPYRALWRADGIGLLIDGGRVYTYTRGEVHARDVRTGRDLWVAHPRDVILGLVQIGSGVVGVSLAVEPGLSPNGTATVFLDATTGAEVARIPSGIIVASAGIVVAHGPSDLAGCGQPPWCADLVGYRARTGAQVWRLPYQADAETRWDLGGGATLARLSSDGTLRVYDVRTGAVARELMIGFWRGDPAPAVGDGQLQLVHGGLVWSRTDPFRAFTAPVASVSFQSTTDSTAWTVSFPRNINANETPLFINDCALWICVINGDGMTVLDAQTGAVLRNLSGVFATGFGRLPLLGLRMLDASPNSKVIVIDPVTGVTKFALPGYYSAAIDGGHGPQLALTAPDRSAISDLVQVRADAPPRTVTTIPLSSGCTVVGDVLVCVHPMDPIHGTGGLAFVAAWQLPPAVR